MGLAKDAKDAEVYYSGQIGGVVTHLADDGTYGYRIWSFQQYEATPYNLVNGFDTRDEAGVYGLWDFLDTYCGGVFPVDQADRDFVVPPRPISADEGVDLLASIVLKHAPVHWETCPCADCSQLRAAGQAIRALRRAMQR